MVVVACDVARVALEHRSRLATEHVPDGQSASALACGAFDPGAVDRLWAKCRAAPGQLSNADNMALVGVLSTQLLHRQLIASQPEVRTDLKEAA